MSDRSRAGSILGGAVVVLLSGVAAWVGARLARQDAAPAAPSRAPAEPTTGSWNDRRLGDIEKRLDLVEQTASAALEMARSHAGPEPGVAPPRDAAAESRAATSPRAPAAPDAAAAPNPDGADAQMEKLQALARTTAKGRVVYTMGLYTDASEEGIANRRAQALADARALVNLYGLKGDRAQDEVRAAIQDQWDRGAHDIGPIVHDGLEKADIATVRERLATLYAETDRRLRGVFDEDTWKQYEAAAAGARKTEDGVLGEFEKARLGTR